MTNTHFKINDILIHNSIFYGSWKIYGIDNDYFCYLVKRIDGKNELGSIRMDNFEWIRDIKRIKQIPLP